jgi:putative ABC transport system permease protein
MAAGLAWSSAIKIAAREMRSSRGKFFFVILSVAIGVAALTGVRGFSSSFRTTLLDRARSIMAADLSARMFQMPTAEEQKGLDEILATGVQMTPAIETVSVASAADRMEPVLVSIKAVDPALYPFYGEVELAPVSSLKAALAGDNIAVADDLLVRQQLHVGDGLRVGQKVFRIGSVVVNEPDRLSSTFAAGPRVLMSNEQLDASGLLAPGNHATRRLLFKLPAPTDGHGISDAAVAALKAKLEALLPQAQLTDYRETNPALTEGLDRATSLLSLMSLVALVLGAVGVAMAMRAHLQQRLDTIAIMKSLGAGSGQIMKIYLLQTLLLGLIGGSLGVLGGVGVQLAFPVVLGKLINVQTEYHIQPRAILVGLGAGILTTLLFTLPPLLDIRGVRPILILRRAVEDSDDPFVSAVWKKITKNIAQILATVLILGGLTAIATTLSDSVEIGKWFSVGLVAVLLVLLAASAALLWGLKFFLNRTRLHLPSSLRHGLANLYRPGNPSAALLAALGMGVMQIMTVYLVQKAVVQELHISSAPNLPNVFLVDIANSEIDGMRTLLNSRTELTTAPELLPVVTSRIEEIDGAPIDRANVKNFPRGMLRATNLSWADAAPPGTKVTTGTWWSAGETKPEVAINERTAGRLGVKVGSTVTFAAGDAKIVATVVALTKSDGQHAYARAEFELPRKVLLPLPTVWYGGAHVDPKQVGTFQRALYAAYPTVTVINVAQALETVRGVVIQITYVVQFLAGFSIFAGVIILASSIAGTKYRRMREVVVLKTLGATRMRIATIFSIEFAVLGAVSGVVGIGFANLIVRVLSHRVFNVAYQVQWMWCALALVGTAVLAVGTGWVASHRILGQKPLEVLREE